MYKSNEPPESRRSAAVESEKFKFRSGRGKKAPLERLAVSNERDDAKNASGKLKFRHDRQSKAAGAPGGKVSQPALLAVQRGDTGKQNTSPDGASGASSGKFNFRGRSRQKNDDAGTSPGSDRQLADDGPLANGGDDEETTKSSRELVVAPGAQRAYCTVDGRSVVDERSMPSEEIVFEAAVAAVAADQGASVVRQQQQQQQRAPGEMTTGPPVQAYLVDDAMTMTTSTNARNHGKKDPAIPTTAGSVRWVPKGKILLIVGCVLAIVVVAVVVGVSVVLLVVERETDGQEASSSAVDAPSSSQTEDPPSRPSGGARSCLPGLYYANYEEGRLIGYVDPLSADNSSIQELSAPDCRQMRHLTFDGDGNAYGVCKTPGDDDQQETIVAVDLRSGNTTELYRLPASDRYPGLTYNPEDGYLYSNLGRNDNNISFVRLEKNLATGYWSNFAGYIIREEYSLSPGFGSVLATDSSGNTFSVWGNENELFRLDLERGSRTRLGRVPYRSKSLAFRGPTTMYVIGYKYPAPVHAIQVNQNKTVTTTWIKNVNAADTVGGDFCPP